MAGQGSKGYEEICEPHKVEQAAARTPTRRGFDRLHQILHSPERPWKTFLCCALGRKHACEYIDDFPHVIEVLLYQERRARELTTSVYEYKSDEYALTDWMVNPSAAVSRPWSLDRSEWRYG